MADDIIAKFTMTMMTFILLPFFASCVHADSPGRSPSWKPSRQAVVVTAEGWDSATATLQLYERHHPDKPWTKVGEKIPVAIGRKGLGWGMGLHDVAPPGVPIKKEGDGRAPAGIFRLSATFGYATPEAMTWVRLPYRQATASLLCIDDASSACYNRIVDAAQVKSDWKGYEEMLRKDDQYRLGIVVDHNADPVVPGNGSCIFMHIWKGPGAGTSGCTAMAPENMENLLRRLDPQARPVLIQFPESLYARYRIDWNLP